MVCGSQAFKSKQICWELPDFYFFSDALNQWLKVNWAWANGVLKCMCLGLPVSGLGSVSLFWYEGRFEWEGGRNGKISTVITTGVWEVSVTLWHLCQFCSEGGECPCTCAAITVPSLSCPVFRRVSSLIVYLSLKWGRCGPSLQLWKLWKGSGCPEASRPTLLAPLLLSWGSYELFLNHVLLLLVECLKFIWVLSCLFWKSYTDSFYLKWLSISPLSNVLMETARIPTLHGTIAVWFRPSHCILRR